MLAATHPFTPQLHALGDTRDGRRLALVPMTPEAATTLALRIAAIGPWARYNFSPDAMQASLRVSGDGAIRYQISIDAVPAGVVIIRSPWLAGPYLQMLAILPQFQNSGSGAAILDWYEATARSARLRNVWLCVSGFNHDAQRFYGRHGYALAGRLAGLIRDGDDELLMRKSLAGPIIGSTPA